MVVAFLLRSKGCPGLIIQTKGAFPMIKLNVDLQRCDAYGTCADLMHDVFRIDQDGTLEQLRSEVEKEREDDLEEVILCCPMGAISRS